jgi:PAS domain-containing protein
MRSGLNLPVTAWLRLLEMVGWIAFIPMILKAVPKLIFTPSDYYQEITVKYRLKRFDGHYRWMLDRSAPQYDANGIFQGYAGSATDINDLLENELLKKDSDDTETTSKEKKLSEELKIANKNLEKSRADLSKLTKALEEKVSSKLLLNAIPQQVWTSDLEGSLDYVNQVVCDDFGYSADQIVGHGWKAFIHPEDVDECFRAMVFCTSNRARIFGRIQIAI